MLLLRAGRCDASATWPRAAAATPVIRRYDVATRRGRWRRRMEEVRGLLATIGRPDDVTAICERLPAAPREVIEWRRDLRLLLLLRRVCEEGARLHRLRNQRRLE